MKKIIIIIWIFFPLIGCARKSNPFANTKWRFTMEGCANYLVFKTDSTYEEDIGCETIDTLYGIYHYQKDTLYLEQKGSVWDSNPNSSEHAMLPRYKLVLEKGKLKHVSREEFYRNKWVKSNFKFDDNFLYEKVLK